MSSSREDANDVAIIGMSGRFPGARSIDEFWANLRSGRECISRFTADDLAASGVDPAALSYPGYVNAGGVVEDIDLFDAAFFGFNAREAEITDPQQRLFLECSWEALEQAGYDPHRYNGPIGVYGGVGMSRYLFQILTNPELMAAVGQVQIVLGNDKDHLTTRVAYKLNLKGPAITVQTACSTSLVAVALAYQSLVDVQCDMALAGGVTIGLPQKAGYVYQPGGINSPDGYCRAFDAEALGTVGGNGVGVVLLKRYEDAIADRDAIHAVIRGAALNNDGSVKVGYTAPSIEGQAAAIATAQAIANTPPETITYIEAHGTGTPLGDPIEIAALTQVFRASTRRTGFCAIGSVKTNIGHLDCGAGVAGLIKAVLALKHRELPPSLHFKHPNPRIDFAGGPFYVNTTLKAWDPPSLPRRAGVSSFGIGGTNAHVVLEEAVQEPESTGLRTDALVTLSARSASALDAASRNLARHLQTTDSGIFDVAYTTAVGRRAFAFRRAVVASDAQSAIRSLSAAAPIAAASGPRKIAFLFPGQGVQYIQMGATLLRTEPVFREHVEECVERLRPLVGFGLDEVIYPSSAAAAAAAERLNETATTQPALFVIEYALARLLDTWGLRPQAMLGHSIGEYVAACLSGVFSLDDALALVVQRGALMQRMPGGAMLAVSLPELELLPLVGPALDVATINARSQTVLSGPFAAIVEVEAQLAAARIPCRRLTTSHAFHSRMMSGAAEALVDAVARVERRPPDRPFLSNVTGDWISPAFAMDPVYWARQLRQTVRFDDGLSRLVADPEWAIVEVGPGVTLSTLARQHPDRRHEQIVTATMPHARDARSDAVALLDAIGSLWQHGVDVNWDAFYSRERRRRVHLPTYPFERQRYWVEPRPAAAPAPDTAAELVRPAEMSRWLYQPAWQPVPARPSIPLSPGSRWLIFEDRSGLAPAVAEGLRALGQDVLTVAPGEEFARTEERRYQINPARAEDLKQLFAALEREGGLPPSIVHMEAVTHTEPAGLFDNGETVFASLLFVAQELGRVRTPQPTQLIIVSNGLHAIAATDHVAPGKALLLGPVRVVPQELPHVRCRSIDVALTYNGSSIDGVAKSLLAEFQCQPADPVMALRGGSRFAQTFRAAPEMANAGDPRLRRAGVYLVTGGFGGIGQALAMYLSRTVAARLVLVGRSTLPPREGWDSWLQTHDAADRTSRAIRQIRALEETGAEVLALQADVADEAAMRRVFESAVARFGALHGVIHCAGVAGGGMIQRKTTAAALQVMAPKLAGTRVLDSLTRQMDLELFVVCSSLSSVLGGFGQIDYCAANAFLDAFAAARARSARGRTVAIAWDTWREVGMAVETAVPHELAAVRQQHLAQGLSTEEGVRAFAAAVAGGAPNVMVSTIDLTARRQGHLGGPTSQTQAQPAPRPSISQTLAPHPRPELEIAFIAPRDEAEKKVAAIWQEMLGVAPIGVNDDFFALGGHSLLAVQVVSRLREAFDVDVPVHLLFDAPTVAELSRSLSPVSGDANPNVEMDRIVDFVEQLSDDEVRRMLGEAPPENPA
jgi:acyl transferase domain-containing protein